MNRLGFRLAVRMLCLVSNAQVAQSVHRTVMSWYRNMHRCLSVHDHPVPRESTLRMQGITVCCQGVTVCCEGAHDASTGSCGQGLQADPSRS